MDTRQIAALSNHHLVSLLFLILSELARRLGIPVVLTPGASQSSDPEAGESQAQPAESSEAHQVCCYGCAIPGCYQWCRHTSYTS